MICAAAFAWANDVVGPLDTGITHNQSDAAQPFAEQAWSVGSQQSLGATVNFTAGSFQHATAPSLKADCKLDLRLLSADAPSGWAVVGTTDQTDTAAGDNSATVAARSTGVGNASLGLTVTFQNTNFSRLAAGNYTTTVTATIAPN